MKYLILFLLFISGVSFSQSKKKIKISLRISVLDQETNEPYPNSKVKLIGTDGSSEIYFTDKKGKLLIKGLKPEYDYTFEVIADGVLGNKGRISTKGIKESKEYVVDVYLMGGCTLRIGFPIVDFPQFSDSLMVKYKDSLNYIREIMVHNPTIIVRFDFPRFKDEDPRLAQSRMKKITQYLVNKEIDLARIQYAFPKVHKNKSDHPAVSSIEIISWDYVPQTIK